MDLTEIRSAPARTYHSRSNQSRLWGSSGVSSPCSEACSGAYQERSPLRVLLSAPHELYSESSVMGFCFVKSQSTRS